jgi:hypothetical protein
MYFPWVETVSIQGFVRSKTHKRRLNYEYSNQKEVY